MKVTKKCWQMNMLSGDRNTIHPPEVTQVIRMKFRDEKTAISIWNRTTCLPNLEIIGWKKFRRQPKLDEAAGQVQFGCQRNFLNPIISKLDKHVVLLLINYIAREVIQLCKENYSNCLWRKTDWVLDLPKLGKASKISGDLWRSPEIVTSLRKSWKVFRWSSEIFGSVGGSSEIYTSVQVIFGNLRKVSCGLR